MASPVVNRSAGTNFTAAADPWTVNLFSSPVAGRLYLLFMRRATAVNSNTLSGWSALVNNSSPDGADDINDVFYRWTDGSEGTTVSVDLTGTAKGGAVALEITGAENPSVQAPQINTVATGAASDSDSGSITPAGGPKDFLYISAAMAESESVTPNVPSGYTSATSARANSGTGGAVATNCRVDTAWLETAASSSEDPLVWGYFDNPPNWSAWTLAIHPPSGPPVERAGRRARQFRQPLQRRTRAVFS
jgi:hypothetical protein